MSTRVIAARSCAPRSRRISCLNCAFTAREWRRSLTSTEAGYFEEQIVHNRSVRRGDYVHRSGATLMALSIINSGFLKTFLTSSNGNVQITGFSMRGDMVGLDALGIGIYQFFYFSFRQANDFRIFQRFGIFPVHTVFQ